MTTPTAAAVAMPPATSAIGAITQNHTPGQRSMCTVASTLFSASATATCGRAWSSTVIVNSGIIEKSGNSIAIRSNCNRTCTSAKSSFGQMCSPKSP